MEKLLTKEEIADAMGQPIHRVWYLFGKDRASIPQRGKKPSKGVRPYGLYYLSDYILADARYAWKGKEAQCRNLEIEYKPQEEIERIEKIKADFQKSLNSEANATFKAKVIELRKQGLIVGAIAKQLRQPIHKVFEIVSRMPAKESW